MTHLLVNPPKYSMVIAGKKEWIVNKYFNKLTYIIIGLFLFMLYDYITSKFPTTNVLGYRLNSAILFIFACIIVVVVIESIRNKLKKH